MTNHRSIRMEASWSPQGCTMTVWHDVYSGEELIRQHAAELDASGVAYQTADNNTGVQMSAEWFEDLLRVFTSMVGIKDQPTTKEKIFAFLQRHFGPHPSAFQRS